MDGLSLLLIVLAIVVVLVLITYCYGSPYAEHFNSKLDELTGQDDILSPQIRYSLNPIKFTILRDEPSEHAYRYTITLDKRATILVTAEPGFRATLDDEELTDILDESRNRRTIVGYVRRRQSPVTLEISTPDRKKPLIHIGTIEPQASDT